MTKSWKIYEVNDMVTKTGKKLKKLVLQGEGDQYPMKNVTCWENHSLFDTLAVGQTIQADVDVKDSTTPNPHGGYYKNRTLVEAKNSNGTLAPDIDLADLNYKVQTMWEERKSQLKSETTDYPENDYPENTIPLEDQPF